MAMFKTAVHDTAMNRDGRQGCSQSAVKKRQDCESMDIHGCICEGVPDAISRGVRDEAREWFQLPVRTHVHVSVYRPRTNM